MPSLPQDKQDTISSASSAGMDKIASTQATMSQNHRREIRFYHLEASSPFEEAPKLVLKAYETGLRSLVLCPDKDFRDRFDEALWSFDQTSFIPHGSDADEDYAPRQPVLVATKGSDVNKPKLLIALNGADLPFSINFDRAFYMFDSREDPVLVKARQDWLACKEKGFTLSYWQKTPAGTWEKKASHIPYAVQSSET